MKNKVMVLTLDLFHPPSQPFAEAERSILASHRILLLTLSKRVSKTHFIVLQVLEKPTVLFLRYDGVAGRSTGCQIDRQHKL